jgi:hypothetical protein
VFTAWAAFIFIYLLVEDPSRNWIFLVIMGIIWLLFSLFLGFQIRYAYRVKNLLKDVHHKAFKRKRFFTKGEPVDVVHKGLRSILKKEKIYITKDESKFRIPELGKFRHNLYLKKLGIRIIIKKNTTLLPGDGSILLVPEKTSVEKLDQLKESIEEAFE